MISGVWICMRVLLRRRREASDAVSPWVLVSSFRRRPPATPRWTSVLEVPVRELTRAEVAANPRPPQPARRRWLDRRP